MNTLQYTVMGVVPLVIINHLLELYLPKFNLSTSPVSMMMEIMAHITVLLVTLYFVDRVVRYFPSYSGKAYGDVSFETIGLILVLLVVNSSNTNLGKKVMHASRHLKERFVSRRREGMKHKSDGTSKSTPNVAEPTTVMGASDGESNQVKGAIDKTDEEVTETPKEPETFSAMSSTEAFAIGGGNYSMF